MSSPSSAIKWIPHWGRVFNLDRRGCWCWLATVVVVCLTQQPARAEVTFEEAARQYDLGDFTAAQSGFAQLAASGKVSANIFFNLGNAEYRLGHVGEAVVAYERALLLDPRHLEAEANLEHVRTQAGARSLAAWPVRALLLPLTAQNYLFVLAAAFWISLFALLFAWRRSGLRPVFAFLAGGSMLVAIYAGLALWLVVRKADVAIVLPPEAVARLEAADRAGSAGDLPAGSEVRVLSEHGEWLYCDLPGERRGWLTRSALQPVGLNSSNR